MFVYGIYPIDFGWENCPTVDDFAATLARREFSQPGYGYEGDFEAYKVAFEKAKELAATVGWEGDFRGPAHVFFVPTEGSFKYGFAWKQDNNGDTFVVSPVPLPHLNEISNS